MRDKVLVLEEGSFEPKEKNVAVGKPLELAFAQGEVRGWIEIVPCSNEGELEGIYLICNEEGKLKGMRPSMAIASKETEEIIDIVVGPVLFCSGTREDEELCPLNSEEVKKVKEMLLLKEKMVAKIKRETKEVVGYFKVPVIEY